MLITYEIYKSTQLSNELGPDYIIMSSDLVVAPSIQSSTL